MHNRYGRTMVALSGLMLLSVVGQTAAQQQQRVDPTNPLGHFIYPGEGQTPEQQTVDKQECYTWASEQTQFSPYDAYQQALQAEQQANAAGQPQGDVVAGAAKGALAGVIIGAIAGDAGEGAAIGAASGGLIGGMKRRQRRRGAEQQAQQQQAEAEAMLQRWDQAYTVCLQGRKYTVS